MRLVFLITGHICLALAVLGVVLPLLPATPLLLLALYFYSRSSRRLHDWLLDHPVFGRLIRNWIESGSIDPRAKVSAVVFMLLTVGATLYLLALPPLAKGALVTLALGLCAFILTRPSPGEVASRRSPEERR